MNNMHFSETNHCQAFLKLWNEVANQTVQHDLLIDLMTDRTISNRDLKVCMKKARVLRNSKAVSSDAVRNCLFERCKMELSLHQFINPKSSSNLLSKKKNEWLVHSFKGANDPELFYEGLNAQVKILLQILTDKSMKKHDLEKFINEVCFFKINSIVDMNKILEAFDERAGILCDPAEILPSLSRIFDIDIPKKVREFLMEISQMQDSSSHFLNRYEVFFPLQALLMELITDPHLSNEALRYCIIKAKLNEYEPLMNLRRIIDQLNPSSSPPIQVQDKDPLSHEMENVIDVLDFSAFKTNDSYNDDAFEFKY